MFEERGQPSSRPQRQGALNLSLIPSGIPADFDYRRAGRGEHEVLTRVYGSARERGGEEFHLEHPDCRPLVEATFEALRKIVERTSGGLSGFTYLPLVGHSYPDGTNEILFAIERNFFWHSLLPLSSEEGGKVLLRPHPCPTYVLASVSPSPEHALSVATVLCTEEFSRIQEEICCLEGIVRDCGDQGTSVDLLRDIAGVGRYFASTIRVVIRDLSNQMKTGRIDGDIVKNIVVTSSSESSIRASFDLITKFRTESPHQQPPVLSVSLTLIHCPDGQILCKVERAHIKTRE